MRAAVGQSLSFLRAIDRAPTPGCVAHEKGPDNGCWRGHANTGVCETPNEKTRASSEVTGQRFGMVLRGAPTSTRSTRRADFRESGGAAGAYLWFDVVIPPDFPYIGLRRIYVQAKRYAPDNIVGRPAVQGFVGALQGVGAAGGVFITTSKFSAEAAAFAQTIKPRIILSDGTRLGELMVRHGVGVQTREVFEVVEVDEDFFE